MHWLQITFYFYFDTQFLQSIVGSGVITPRMGFAPLLQLIQDPSLAECERKHFPGKLVCRKGKFITKWKFFLNKVHICEFANIFSFYVSYCISIVMSDFFLFMQLDDMSVAQNMYCIYIIHFVSNVTVLESRYWTPWTCHKSPHSLKGFINTSVHGRPTSFRLPFYKTDQVRQCKECWCICNGDIRNLNLA